MSWVTLALAAVTAIALIALLGLPAALALRLRGFALVLVAVPAAFAVMAVATIGTAVIGVRWSILPAVALALALAAALFALRRWLGAAKPAGRRGRELWLPVSAAAIGGAVIAASLATALQSADAISQTFDAGFHLGAVRFILDTGTASPFGMELTSPGAPVFYPTLWHAYVALIAQLTGASIPIATNAALITVSAVVWPLGAVAFGRAVAGPSTRVTLISGALAAAFPNFPLFLAGYGVIYPNLLALALLPFLLVAWLQLLNLGAARRAIPLTAGTRWLLLFGSFGAAVLAHPNAIHAALVWAAIPTLIAAVRAFRGGPVPDAHGLLAPARLPLTARRVAAALGILLFIAVTVVAWVGGRTTDNVWQGFFGPRSAAAQVLGSTPHIEGDAWAVSVIVLLGAVIAWRHRTLRWVLGSAALLALFYYIADGFPTADWRSFFLSPWYNDSRRLAALIPFGALPLAVLGASAGWAMLRPGLRRFARARRGHGSGSARRPLRWLTIGSLALLVAIGQSGSLSAMQAVRTSYDQNNPQLISRDERKLLQRLGENVPEGELIANNPLNGSGLSYALADRAVLFPHAGGVYDPRRYELVDSLVKEPQIACRVAKDLGVNYVLDFGTNYVLEPTTRRAKPFKRMTHLERSPILTEVDSQGEARLFQITGCGA